MSIEVSGLTKAYPGGFRLEGVSFEVARGQVVGFLGPNGAGKSTTLRLLFDLETPDSGSTRFDGRRYRDLERPLTTVGALLDPTWIYPKQTGMTYLRWVAASNGISRMRIPAVLEQVGLASVAQRKIGAFSMGMRQRLGLAAALLGNPDYLVFDEPLNGLDPEGIIWMRKLIRQLAAQGKGVLLSSHQLGEVSQTADSVVMIAKGQIRGQGNIQDLLHGATDELAVRVADNAAAAAVLQQAYPTVELRQGENGELMVGKITAPEVNRALVQAGIDVLGISEESVSLEDIFLQRLEGGTEYRGAL